MKNHLLFIVTALVICIPAIKNIWLPGYYPMHDDLQLMRSLQMDKCFQDGQIPCRWVPDMGYGYGYPLFNYYPPMPYYLGQLFRSVGFSYISTAKIVFTLGFVVSAIGMYLLAAALWGKWGGLISSVFYVYAPYHATDLYVRGAVNEFWAIAWYPFILWSIYRLIHSQKNIYVALLSYFTSMLMLSHNPMLMIFVPLALLWTLYWIWQTKSLKTTLPKLILSGIWAAGLAAFFTLPVILEQKFVHIETLVIGYFNYLAHFLDLNQLFITMKWGYGESLFGPGDTMSFNIGHLHWILAGIVGFLAFIFWRKYKHKSSTIMLLLILTIFYTFMMHWKATPVWMKLKPLEFLQFPWRLLSVVIFGASLLVGGIASFIQKRAHIIQVTIILVSLVVLLNYKYFDWRDHWPWVSDQHKFSGELWRLQTTSGIYDYLPIWAPLPPANPPQGDAVFVTGQGATQTVTKKSNFQKYQIRVDSAQAQWMLNTFFFPGWKYFLNNQEIKIDPQNDLDKADALPIFNLSQGTHLFEARFTKTHIRAVSDILSAVSWIALAIFFIKFITRSKSSP